MRAAASEAVGLRDLPWKPRAVFLCLVTGFFLHILAWCLE